MKIKLSFDEEKTIRKIKEFDKNRNKLCVFSHFDEKDIIEPYVVFFMCALNKIGFDIVFVSTSNLKIYQSNKISKYIKTFIVRDNIGYDFLSYKIGLSIITDYTDYKMILFTNDSIFFPLFNPKHMFDSMKKRKLDFWGITSSYDVHYHIQSFFWVFNTKVLKSNVFYNFWNNIEMLHDKKSIIYSYELPLAVMLLKCHFKVGSYVDPKDICRSIGGSIGSNGHFLLKNPFYYFWNFLIKYGKAPFIKKNILIQGNEQFNISTKDYKDIIEETDYDFRLIEKYLDGFTRQKLTIENELNKYYDNLVGFLDYFNTVIKEKKIVIYCANDIGMILKGIAYENDNSIVDKNYQVINRHYSGGIEVASPNTIKKYDFDLIIVASLTNNQSIKNDLSLMQIDLKKVVFLSTLNIDMTVVFESFQKIFKLIEIIYITYSDQPIFHLGIKNNKLKQLIALYLKINNLDERFIYFDE